MAARGIPLNSAWLRNRIAELGLKQWWLAEQLRVDKKTVGRWLQGRVRVMQRPHAQALAAVLGCRIEDFKLAADTVDLASADDQRAAAALLSSGLLIDKLGPVGDWDVVETLVKAVAVPDLPVHVLGELYHQLCVASWRQGKLDAAEHYNRATFEMANRCGDKRLLARAYASGANLLHWRGDTGLAIEHYRHCLTLERYLDPDARKAIWGQPCTRSAKSKPAARCWTRLWPACGWVVCRCGCRSCIATSRCWRCDSVNSTARGATPRRRSPMPARPATGVAWRWASCCAPRSRHAQTMRPRRLCTFTMGSRPSLSSRSTKG